MYLTPSCGRLDSARCRLGRTRRSLQRAAIPCTPDCGEVELDGVAAQKDVDAPTIAPRKPANSPRTIRPAITIAGQFRALDGAEDRLGAVGGVLDGRPPDPFLAT